jgi:Lhr-like helicase
MTNKKIIQKMNQSELDESTKECIQKYIQELSTEKKRLQKDNLILRETISEQNYLLNKLFEGKNREEFIKLIKDDFYKEMGFNLKHI